MGVVVVDVPGQDSFTVARAAADQGRARHGQERWRCQVPARAAIFVVVDPVPAASEFGAGPRPQQALSSVCPGPGGLRWAIGAAMLVERDKEQSGGEVGTVILDEARMAE
jgi:hypothetical protein